MKALRIHGYGGPEVLRYEDAPDPEPGHGEVIVRVRACGMNHLDLDLRDGSSRIPLELPFIPGLEPAGEVEALGPGVSGVKVGDRVAPTFYYVCGHCPQCKAGRENLCANNQMFGVTRPGGYAERVVAPASTLLKLADHVSFDQAAATQVAFGTAFHMLIGRAKAQAGETVLVQAAGSGIGSAAVQIASQLGLRIIATAGSQAKLEQALAMGAQHAINYRDEAFLPRVMEITAGKGVDIVFEHVGGEVFTNSVAALAIGGRLVTCGAHGGEVTSIDIIELFRKEASVLGSYTTSMLELRQVMLLVELGKLKPVIHRALPLAEGAQAHKILANREHFGKVVLNP